MGGLEEAKRTNERDIARREEVVKELAHRHNFRGMDVIMDESQIDEVKSLLFKSLKEEKGQLDKVKVPIHKIVSNLARIHNSRKRFDGSNPRA